MLKSYAAVDAETVAVQAAMLEAMSHGSKDALEKTKRGLNRLANWGWNENDTRNWPCEVNVRVRDGESRVLAIASA